jgi:hypothetical protein
MAAPHLVDSKEALRERVRALNRAGVSTAELCSHTDYSSNSGRHFLHELRGTPHFLQQLEAAVAKAEAGNLVDYGAVEPPVIAEVLSRSPCA